MRQLRGWFRRLAAVFTYDRQEREFADELEGHLRLHIDDNIRSGMSPDAARRHALLKLGGVELTKELHRDRRGLPAAETFARDLRYGLRMLIGNPGFTLVAVSTLALSMSATVIVFSLGNALLFRPLGVTDPDRVIRAYTNRHTNTVYADYLEYRDHNRTLAALAAFQLASLSLRADGAPEHVFGMVVSGNYFQALGIPAARGRVIEAADDGPGAAGVVLLSDGYWRRRFASDPSVVGRAVTINGHPFTIVGITPSGFSGTMAPIVPELWAAWNAPGLGPSSEEIARRGGRSGHLIGRLRPGASLPQAQADLAAIAASLALAFPETNRDRTVTVYPGRTLTDEFGSATTMFVAFLMGVAGLVLVIACTNIASLLVARSAARRREIATRLALGASRRRLVRQLLTESLLLSACGGLIAFVVSAVAARALETLRLPAPIPVGLDLTFDWRVMVFSAGVSFLATLLFGLMPALHASRNDVVPGLKGGASTAGPGRARLRATLLAAQVAMSTLLLVTAGLLVRSLSGAHAIDRGFSSGHVLTASVDLDTRGYTPERGAAFYAQLLERVEQIPGVAGANLVDIVPLTLSNRTGFMLKEGQEPPPSGASLEPIYTNTVSRGHFKTLSIPLLAGRDFEASDRVGTPGVAIVNETLARRYWPGEPPIGKRLREFDWRGSLGPWIEVVGLVRDSKYVTIGEDAKGFMYQPLTQTYRPAATLLVKVAGEPLAAFPAVRDQVNALDPDLPVFGAQPLDAATSVSLLPLKVAVTLAGALGLVALALAAIGLYGVMSYLVRQQTREIGVRMALGAPPAEVVWFVVRQGMRWTSIGIVLGLAAGLGVARLLTGLLYGVRSTDPVAFVGVPLVLAATAYIACWMPGRRASRIDPLVALRED